MYALQNLVLYHYGANSPIRFVDPDGREITDDIENIVSMLPDFIDADWENPVFFVGVSANATVPIWSVGTTVGEYFVPRNNDDKLFYGLLGLYLHSIASVDSGTRMAGIIAHELLKNVSSEYGIMVDALANSGFGITSLDLSASVSGTFGIFRSLHSMEGNYIESGISGGVLGISFGFDAAINLNKELLGITASIGVGIGPPEIHTRFGNTVLVPIKGEQIR